MAEKKYKVFDRRLLSHINESSIGFKYNRTLDPAFIARLPEDKIFPVVFTMLHEHRAGKACEPHVRVMIAVPSVGETAGLSDRLLLDVNMDLFDIIPEIGVPENDPETTPVAE
jgi:hypothetical protein